MRSLLDLNIPTPIPNRDSGVFNPGSTSPKHLCIWQISRREARGLLAAATAAPHWSSRNHRRLLKAAHQRRSHPRAGHRGPTGGTRPARPVRCNLGGTFWLSQAVEDPPAAPFKQMELLRSPGRPQDPTTCHPPLSYFTSSRDSRYSRSISQSLSCSITRTPRTLQPPAQRLWC